MKAFSKRATCTEEECSCGIRRVDVTKEIIISEKNKVLENIITTTVSGMKECGRMESSTEKGPSTKTDTKFSLEDGTKGFKKKWGEFDFIYTNKNLSDVSMKLYLLDLNILSY
jgi:hypothetical protein